MKFLCDGCGNEVPVVFKNEHHIEPIEYGGKDVPENKARLDVGCHQVLHYLAYRRASGKGDVESLLNDYLISVSCADLKRYANKMVTFINIVAAKYILVKQKVITVEDSKLKRVTVHIPNGTKELLKLDAKNMNLSFDLYVTIMLLNNLKLKYPSLKEIINKEILRLQYGEEQCER